MRSGSGGVSGGHGGGVNNKRNSSETGASAVGAVLLDGNYDKELSSIRGQVREAFLAVGEKLNCSLRQHMTSVRRQFFSG